MQLFKSEKQINRPKDALYASIQEQFVTIYHTEIDRRYNVENLARHEEILQSKIILLNQEKTNLIKDFFKVYLYPADKARQDRDTAFLSLIQLLHNPTRLVSLFPAMPKIMWHIGRRFPQALSVGLDSNEAFYLSLMLENNIINRLIIKIKENQTNSLKDYPLSVADVKWAYCQNDYADANKLYKLGMTIFSRVKDKELILITMEILHLVKEQMQKSPDKFQRHILAIDYGIGVLQHTMAIFRPFQNEEIDTLMQIVNIIEKKYMDSIFARVDFSYSALNYKN